MKPTVLIGAAIAVAGLSGCQTNYTYTKIGPGPTMEYAQAKCQMAAPMVDQGYFAYGSANFVVGASIGNAISNGIREDQFVKQCMILQGWKRVSIPQNPNATPAKYRAAQRRAAAANRHKTGRFPPPPSS